MIAVASPAPPHQFDLDQILRQHHSDESEEADEKLDSWWAGYGQE